MLSYIFAWIVPEFLDIYIFSILNSYCHLLELLQLYVFVKWPSL